MKATSLRELPKPTGSLLHKADNNFHTEAYQDGYLFCAATGMGHSDAGIAVLIKAFEREGLLEANVSSDASAFDLSMPGILIHADGDRRAENCADPLIGELLQWYSHVLCSHVLCNGNDVWLCEKHGCTSTGQLSTSSQNTFARGVTAAYGGAKGWTNTGDDLVAQVGFDPVKIEELGIYSRDAKTYYGEANFTSHLINFTTGKAVFTNVEKLLWTLYDNCQDIATNSERFGGNLYVLRNTPGVYDDLFEIVKAEKIDVSVTECDLDEVLEYM